MSAITNLYGLAVFHLKDGIYVTDQVVGFEPWLISTGYFATGKNITTKSPDGGYITLRVYPVLILTSYLLSVHKPSA
jgi:hypothetical protein